MNKVFKYSMIGLISLAIILILVIFFAHICVICKSNIQADEEIIQNLISMQSITLAVTGISVTVVSIVVSLISIYREKKIEEAEHLINSLKQELSNIKDDARQKQEKLENILYQENSKNGLKSRKYSKIKEKTTMIKILFICHGNI